ncbi:hypothetical protein Hanom_Chr04g00372601 [Helianthus anomalus]
MEIYMHIDKVGRYVLLLLYMYVFYIYTHIERQKGEELDKWKVQGRREILGL